MITDSWGVLHICARRTAAVCWRTLRNRFGGDRVHLFFGLQAGVPQDAAMVVAITVGFMLRLLAIIFKIEMPRFVYAPVRDQSSRR